MNIHGRSIIYGLIVCACGAPATAHAGSIDGRVSPRAHARRISSNDNEQMIRNEELAVARDLKTRVDQGDAAAMNGLGMMYALGRGVDKNYEMARDLFRRAALQGQVPGMVNVGLLYDRHTNQPGHSISAYAWLRAALSFGVPDEDPFGVDLAYTVYVLMRRRSICACRSFLGAVRSTKAAVKLPLLDLRGNIRVLFTSPTEDADVNVLDCSCRA